MSSWDAFHRRGDNEGLNFFFSLFWITFVLCVAFENIALSNLTMTMRASLFFGTPTSALFFFLRMILGPLAGCTSSPPFLLVSIYLHIEEGAAHGHGHRGGYRVGGNEVGWLEHQWFGL